MASTNSWTYEIESSVAAPRLFCAGVKHWHVLAPKLVPQIVVSAHSVEEDEGSIGSVVVRQFDFTSAMPFSLLKERIEFLDAEKCEFKWTLIEGGGIGTGIEMATSHVKVEPTANGGSVVKVDSSYKFLPSVEVNDEITKAKESVTAIFKTVEAYLIANPQEYTV
ncbi:pathogenesis-related protein 1 [Brachypodium distachyon]|uniref:Bet v I/Major latex protein domain-containing protein n=1 Tax=Brachypodium distachyon TaxID=15368 RepID=I1H6C6_BRADI|nr:pathogenesis-related protein 1 [Brachypodium distachyon]KQK22062.1 hypothetical protein BRADI_1g64880v3 [Brachypodium distachyon]|eukprot:XP_003558108.1 pathogenesis-related protein 1 [Brachypodium distachyon]